MATPGAPEPEQPAHSDKPPAPEPPSPPATPAPSEPESPTPPPTPAAPPAQEPSEAQEPSDGRKQPAAQEPSAGQEPDELTELRQRVAVLEKKTPAPPRHRLRSLLAAVLITLAAVLTPLSAIATWTNSQISDTDRYVATVAPLAKDPAVQSAVTNRVTDLIMQQLPIDSLLADIAPADRPLLDTALKKIGPALTSGLTGFVHDQVQRLVESDAFATVWVNANRNIHAAVDKALTGKGGGAVEIKGDTVTLDLAPLIDEVKTRLVDRGVGIAAKIPEVHTDITLIRSDSVQSVQTGFRLLELVGFWLPVVTLLCAVGGVLLAARRRRAVVTTAIAMAVGAGVLGIGLTVFRVIYLDKLPAGVNQDAAAAVYDALVRYLRAAVRMLLALGIVVALGAWLSGGGRRAGAVRGLWQAGLGAVRDAAERLGMRLGPVGRFVHRWKAWLGWGVTCVLALVLLLWSYPTVAVVIWLALLLLLVLAILEFLDQPDEPDRPDRPAGPGDPATAAGG
ncbi:hypothetical protein [Kitasatospora sp. NPDC088346]|uniref:hypothetical protein n=1 Tax=Kitasatospora sp. NPDC088346 TaxID=3364073 RepID=UPI0037F50B88